MKPWQEIFDQAARHPELRVMGWKRFKAYGKQSLQFKERMRKLAEPGALHVIKITDDLCWAVSKLSFRSELLPSWSCRFWCRYLVGGKEMTEAQRNVLNLLADTPLSDVAVTVHRVRRDVLRALEKGGLARYAPYGSPPGWRITPAGRAAISQLKQ